MSKEELQQKLTRFREELEQLRACCSPRLARVIENLLSLLEVFTKALNNI